MAAGFPKQGGDALDLDGRNEFQDSEDVDEAEDDDEIPIKKSGA